MAIRWKYNDDERPEGVCYDCKIPYNSFPDMVIKNELWEQINPTNHKGAGLLCPSCIGKRLNLIGVEKVTVKFYDGQDTKYIINSIF